MPRTLGGLFGYIFSTVIVVAVGIFVLSRIRPLWRVLMAPQG